MTTIPRRHYSLCHFTIHRRCQSRPTTVSFVKRAIENVNRCVITYAGNDSRPEPLPHTFGRPLSSRLPRNYSRRSKDGVATSQPSPIAPKCGQTAVELSGATWQISGAHNGQDPALQSRELEEYCRRRGWEVAGCYVNTGVSGSEASRPELDRLMADSLRRRFDAVTVWKFDRFARSVPPLLHDLETYNALGIDFVSLSEQIDTSTPTGKMVFTVLGAVAAQLDC